MEQRKLKPDLRIAWLSFFGLGGFILGCIFLFYTDLNFFNAGERTKSIFHEIVYVPKALIKERVVSVLDSILSIQVGRQVNRKLLTDSLKSADSSRKVFLTRAIADLDQQTATDDSNLKALRNLQASYDRTSDYDTASFQRLNKSIHFSIGPKELNDWEKLLDSNKNVPLRTNYVLKEPGVSFSIPGTASFVSRTASSDIEFTSKYPGTGIWILLIMVFCSFLAIAIPTSIFIRDKIGDLFEEYNIGGVKKREFMVMAVVTFFCLFLIWLIGRFTFNDEDVVRGIYFMYHLKTSMMLLQFLGFAGGSFCLAGFIHTASMLAYFAKSVKKSRKTIQKKRAALMQSPTTDNQTEEQMKQQVKDTAGADNNGKQ